MEINYFYVMLFIIIAYFIYTKTKESFEDSNQSKKDKACGQQSINYGFLSYQFNSPDVPRRA